MYQNRQIAVAMSGGVDSSVAAFLLREAGARVTGITLRLRHTDDSDAEELFITDAREVANRLGIAHHVLDLRARFETEIVAPFVEAYARGETPSPCILCNRQIKFGVLLEQALALGCEFLATGHYARLEAGPDGEPVLRRGNDPEKDQSYFLFGLNRFQLRHACFPVGGFRKAEVRELARRHGFRPHERGESQDLCFLADADYQSLMMARFPELSQAGPIVDPQGKVLGTHEGFFRYTRGQRRGLGLGGGPWYVLRVVPESNTVVVGSLAEAAGCHVQVRILNWVAAAPEPGSELEVQVQLRYKMTPVPARLTLASAEQAVLVLGQPVTGISPGQAAVFYEGDRVLGGGWITGTDP